MTNSQRICVRCDNRTADHASDMCQECCVDMQCGLPFDITKEPERIENDKQLANALSVMARFQ